MTTAPDPRAGLPSASALPRLSKCAASWRLAQQATRQGIGNNSSAASDSGHRIHRWLETSDEIDWAALTEDEQVTARACAKHATTIIDEWNDGGNYQRRHEHRLWLYDDGAVVSLRSLGKPIFSGAADVIVINEDNSRAAILDFKTGRGDYEPAKGNLQLAALAVLVAGWTGARSVRVALIQPLAGPPSVADYDGEELDKTRADLLRLLDHIEEPGLVPHPGDHCQFCAAKPICPALTHELAMLSDPSLTSEETKEAIAESAGDLDAKRLGDYLHTAKRVQWMIDALKDEAKRRIEACDPSAPIGWTLRPGAKTREVNDSLKAFEILNARFGLTQEEMAAACKVSLPTIETTVAKRTDIPKTRVSLRIADALGPLIVIGQKAPSLVEDKPKLIETTTTTTTNE
jgi:hypothetical protein